MNDVPTKQYSKHIPVIIIKHRKGLPPREVDQGYSIQVPEVDIQELFRHDPVGLEKYQERRLGIEQRLDKVIRRKI
jgi:hypothetical protein